MENLNEIWIVFGVLAVLAFIAVGYEADKREIGTEWALILAFLTTPFVALFAVVISPRKKQNIEDVFYLDYRAKALAEFESIKNSGYKDVFDHDPYIRELKIMIINPPTTVFKKVVLKKPNGKIAALTFDRYDKVKNTKEFQNTEIIGYKK